MFRQGLNVLLADRTEQSTEGHTRNSAGKTSAVEIVHFLLGSDANKDSLFQKPALASHAFRGRLRLGGHEVTVSRTGNDAQRVFLSAEDAAKLGIELSQDQKTGVEFISLKRWREILGHFWFDLPLDPKGTPFGQSFSPSFRSLISYFARRNKHGGFNAPEKQGDKQQPYDYQINLSYLLGLDWTIPRAIEEVRLGESTVKDLKKAIKEGALGKIFGTVAEIRPELARIEDRIERLARQVETFEVLESYREHYNEAAQAKGRLQEISFELVMARETITHLERTISEERPPEYAVIERLYSSAGVELPGVALRRFEDVERFQRSVIENRRIHLQAQIDEAKERVAVLEAEMGEVDRRRAEIMKMLEGKGALEDYTRLVEEIAGLQSQASILAEKLKNAEILEGKRTVLQKERVTLLERLQEDHRSHSEELRRAILRIDQAISALYEDRTGNFIVEATSKGPEFKISIQGDGNRGGIDRMEVFCFDLMLFQTAAERFASGPGFVMHDSHLFDGVDARQVRSAILLGRQAALDQDGQYIVALNSDVFEQLALPEEIAPQQAVLSPRLSDLENGGIFGIRFD